MQYQVTVGDSKNKTVNMANTVQSALILVPYWLMLELGVDCTGQHSAHVLASMGICSGQLEHMYWPVWVQVLANIGTCIGEYGAHLLASMSTCTFRPGTCTS
jgi:hypothetical protein